jgi:S1-C subfamily serine protease
MRVPVKSFRLFGVAVALLVLAGCQTFSEAPLIGELPDVNVCRGAIQGSQREPTWETAPAFRNYVEEAKRRNLSDQQCARLTGLFTEQQIAAVHQTPTAPTTASIAIFANRSNQEICKFAILGRRPNWIASIFIQDIVDEAKRRGYSEQQCARLTGRFTEKQIAAVHDGPKIKSPDVTSRPTPQRRPPPNVRPTQKPELAVKSTPKKPNSKRRARFGTGSGFFISKSGHVVTNAHVVIGCQRITVGDNTNTQSRAALVSTDKRNDLALLKLGSLEMASAETKSLIQKLGIKVVPLVAHGLLRSEDVELGESVLVAGFPYGELYSNTIKVTGGMVSAVRGIGDDSGQFQMDAAAQAGNSGGPIYDAKGNIVGVVVAQLNKFKVAKATGSLPENVNFGIKASTVRQFLTASGLPSRWSTRTKKMSTTELAKIAQRQTLMVICHK